MEVLINSKLEMPSLSKLLEKMSFEAGSEEADIAAEMLEASIAHANPTAMIQKADISDSDGHFSVGGIEICYPFVQSKLKDSSFCIAYIITCGKELEQWSESFTDPLEVFIADQIKLEFLGNMINYTIAYISEVYLENKKHSALNPGSLKEWPISEQVTLFKILGGNECVNKSIGVTLKESFLMLPSKSVSGLLYTTEDTHENCMYCPKLDCPNRHAEYIGEWKDQK